MASRGVMNSVLLGREKWAYFDDRQNRLRTVAGDSVSLLWTLGCTLFQM